MGALLGLVAGLGVLLVGLSFESPRSGGRRVTVAADGRLARLLRDAGVPDVRPRRLVASCTGVAVSAAVLMAGLSRTTTIAVAFGLLAGVLPVALLRRRGTRRQAAVRTAWPDLVDDLASAVRAGLSLPEALCELAVTGPAPLRPPFHRFGADLRATGRFGEALDALKADLSDPVADRVIESLRLAREVGGTDLGRVLRALSAGLREDARWRGEVAARQSWTVNGARLAVAAPWLVLAFLSLRPEAVQAYGTTAGAVVLAVVGAAGVVAYRLMLRIGRLPRERRVLA